MLAILSPAKTLDFSKISRKIAYSIPVFNDNAEILIKLLRNFKPSDLSSLMGISAKLADLNFERFLKWNKNHKPENSKLAIFAFNGDVYEGLDVSNLSIQNLEFLNTNLRILSGLYGVLKPFDLIMGYRLEMGTKMANKNGKDLYSFWEKKISENINEAIEKSYGERVLINLASNEYFKVIDLKTLKYPIITPVFKEFKDNGYQIVSFYAKKARGMMARFIAMEKITTPVKIKLFNLEGYIFNQELSGENQWVFTR